MTAGYYRSWESNFRVTDNQTGHAGGLQHVLRQGADRSPASERRRLRRLRPRGRLAGEVRPDQQPGAARIRLRRSETEQQLLLA